MKTLYEYATEMMTVSIEKYLELARISNGFSLLTNIDVSTIDNREMLLSGKSLEVKEESPQSIYQNLERVKSIEFDVEKGVSYFVYKRAREYIIELVAEAREITKNYSKISAIEIKERPYLLPIWQAALSISSKSNLKAIFGSASDHNISKPSSEKIADYANDFFLRNKITDIQIIERVERTLEGIVRDLVGRLLLESVVRNALEKTGVPFLDESQYSGIDGVIYKIRADFVIPNEKNPLAFIEVRKSSSRHASLYAKDKMFSAINWKGKHKKILGIIVTEGEWTNESLITMSKVFDYVVPLASSEMLAQNIKKYLDGDNSILKWIINFSITPNK